jgi:hypothetical protein
MCNEWVAEKEFAEALDIFFQEKRNARNATLSARNFVIVPEPSQPLHFFLPVWD